MVAPVKKKRVKTDITEGCVVINATFNNTVVTISDSQGNVLAWSSAGKMGFSGSRQSTPHAATIAANDAAEAAKNASSLNRVHVLIKGPGPGREPAVRAIAAAGIKILSIEDGSSIPHNGTRQRKKRNV